MTRPPLAVVELGQRGYLDTHALQRALADRRIAGAIAGDVLLLVEHEPTVTLGRGTRGSSLPLGQEELEGRGLTVVEVERGGDVTWHGPGQLVGYPILDLQRHRPDLHWYLRQVEESLIRALGTLGIGAARRGGFTGVWTAGGKIASIGIHVRQWVTTHGFALNVVNPLDGFGLIVPCGIDGVTMTSVWRELTAADHSPPSVIEAQSTSRRVRDAVVEAVGEVFGLQPVPASLVELLPAGVT
jgi:lipoyl(octanoyl) transferase